MQDVNFPNRSFPKLELVPKATGTQRVSNNPLSNKDSSPYPHTLKVIKHFQQPKTKINFCFRELTTMELTKKVLSFNWYLHIETGELIILTTTLTNTNRRSFLCLNTHTHTHLYKRFSSDSFILNT